MIVASAVCDAAQPFPARWVWPLPVLGDSPPTVARSWRPFDDERPHLGADLMYARQTAGGTCDAARYLVPEGVPVLAAGAGVVRFASDSPRGFAVVVAHPGGRSTYYAHLAGAFVARGQPVDVGQPLGLVGHDLTDPRAVRHLHFEVWLHGTRSTAVDPAPLLASWTRLRYAPAADGPRNVAWLGIKTPGVILNEMNITDGDVRALGRDVYATFRRPWEAQFEQARGRFKRERGREPGIGNDSDPKAEFAQVYAWMDPPSTVEDVRWKTYQGAFVHAWGEFERSWEAFYEENKGAWPRMWRGTFDQALDFRRRVQDWRKKFEALGGAPSAPAPHIPDETSPLGDIPWRSIVVAAGGIAAGLLVLPPVIRAMRKEP